MTMGWSHADLLRLEHRERRWWAKRAATMTERGAR
jgi:hypothetical protein